MMRSTYGFPWPIVDQLDPDQDSRTFVTPGELLKIDASVVHEGSGFSVTEARVSVDGKLKCNATITFRHVPFPNPDLRGHMEAMAERIGFPRQAAAHD